MADEFWKKSVRELESRAARAEARGERLREALQGLLLAEVGLSYVPDDHPDKERLLAALNAAKAALEPKP